MDTKVAGTTPIILESDEEVHVDAENAWDHIDLAGRRAPGVVSFSAKDGAKPGEFRLTLTIWTPQQWEDLQKLLPDILPAAGPTPVMRKVEALHPQLQMFGVQHIGIAGAELPRWLVDENGKEKHVCEFSFQCWLPKVGAFDGADL